VANIVQLSDVRTHLRFPNPDNPSTEDTVLQWFINAADEVLSFECDNILPTLYSERYDGGDLLIHTREVPILEVLNVEEGWGWINYELDFVDVNSPAPTTSMFAYSIDSMAEGQISRRSAGNVQIPFIPGTANIFIQYKAGESSIPGNVFLAELELIAHWYQNSQLRAVAMAGANVAYDAVAGSMYSRDTESGVQNINIGVPYRILEMIKAHRHRPIIA
jgi:hypothetical protein